MGKKYFDINIKYDGYNKIPKAGFFKIILGNIAYFLTYPSFIIAFIHRLRGVKIASISKVFFSFGVCLDSLMPHLIEIAEDVYITRNVTILTHLNPTKSIKQAIGNNGMKIGHVKIEKGVFIGCGSIILPGVTLGTCSIVGAGSVVTKDVLPYTVVAGNPAKEIGNIKDLLK